MTAIEKALLDIINLAKSYIKTFVALLFNPSRVLNSLIPEFHSSVKYFNPVLFFVFATFLSFTIRIEAHTNIFGLPDFSMLAQSLPSFIHGMNFFDVLLYTSPVIFISYIIIEFIAASIFIPSNLKKIFTSYTLYSFAMGQLLVFLSLLTFFFINQSVANVQRTVLLYAIMKTTEVIIIGTPYILVLVLPFSSIRRVFYKNNKKLFYKFLFIPFLIPLLYLLTASVYDTVASYKREMEHKENIEFITLSDNPHAILLNYWNNHDSTYSATTITFFNHSNDIYILPSSFVIVSAPVAKPYIVHYLEMLAPHEGSKLLKPNDLCSATYISAFSNKDTTMLYRINKDTLINTISIVMECYNFKGEQSTASNKYSLLVFRKVQADSLGKFEALFAHKLPLR